MFGKKVIVIGGSIAGCTAAILLERLGAKVTVLERSNGVIGQGAGITLPEDVVNQCKALDLFDSNISCITNLARSFSRKNDLKDSVPEIFWTQGIRATALNWADVYQNLRKRVVSKSYHTKTEVSLIKPLDAGYRVETTTGEIYEAELVIAADGVDSLARAYLLPEIHPQYAGYIAWRGILNEQALPDYITLDKHVPYYVFPNGHLLMYRIPALDFEKTGRTLLNWVMYENRQDLPLKELLIDSQGKQHSRSLPAGSLTELHKRDLHTLAERVLPSDIRKIVELTPQPFIQAVYDFQLPAYSSNQIIFMGDSASTLRPHTASGVFKALNNGIDLFNLIIDNPNKSLTELIEIWKDAQQKILAADVQKAKNMGEALVTNPPKWESMNQQSTDQWWAEVMQGKSWYATSASEVLETAKAGISTQR